MAQLPLWGTLGPSPFLEQLYGSPGRGLLTAASGMLAHGVNSGQGLGIEIIGTLQLVLCVLATTDRRRRDLGGSAPLAIGFSVALGHLLAIDYTGCGINPARSFGSAVITRNFSNHWIFWVGPFIGGALAVLIYDFILAPRSSDLTDRLVRGSNITVFLSVSWSQSFLGIKIYQLSTSFHSHHRGVKGRSSPAIVPSESARKSPSSQSCPASHPPQVPGILLLLLCAFDHDLP